MTSSSVLDLSAITLSEIRGVQNTELTAALRQTISTAARDNATAVQMQDE